MIWDTILEAVSSAASAALRRDAAKETAKMRGMLDVYMINLDSSSCVLLSVRQLRKVDVRNEEYISRSW